MIRTLALVSLLLLAAVGRAATQEPGVAIEPGTRVRVVALEVARRPIVGRVSAVFPDTMLVEVSPESARVIPLAGIQSLEVSLGRQRGRGFWRGAAIGLGVSAALEAVALVHDSRNPGEGAGMSLVIPVMVAPVVTLAGGLIGASRGPDRWEVVTVPR